MLIGMAYSDTLVYETLVNLLRDNPTGRIRHNDIRALSGVPDRTLQRALKRLVDGRKLERHFQQGVGYTYRVP